MQALAVARDPGERKRRPDDRRGRQARGHQRAERVEPFVPPDEPQRDHEHRHREPAARVREEQRDDPHEGEQRAENAPASRDPQSKRKREVTEQRELVPQTRRTTQPRDRGARDGGRVVAGKRRDHLPEQSPHGNGGEQDGEADRQLARAVGKPQPDQREEQVDERAIRVVPGAVRQRRPPDRGSAPGGERSQRQQPQNTSRRATNGEQGQNGEQGPGAEPGERPRLQRPAGEQGSSAEGQSRAEWPIACRPHPHDHVAGASAAHKSLTPTLRGPYGGAGTSRNLPPFVSSSSPLSTKT